MSNRIKLGRVLGSGNVPALLDLLTGEMVINIPDKNVYYSNGLEVVHLNAAANIRTDATHRFVSDADIASWNTPYTLPAATDTILGGVKVGQNLLVDMDGTLHIDTADATHTGVLSSADWNTFNNKQNALGYTPVDKAGDTMLGSLQLSSDPLLPLHAATKQYVDNELANKLDLAGGTLTGSLILAGDPVAGLGAATKQYVDTAINDVSGSYASPVQDLIELAAIIAGNREDKQLRLVEDTGAIYRYDAQASDAADGNGVILPSDNPVTGRWFKVQAATQNHNNLFGLQGGAVGDYLHLTTAEKNSYDAHLIDTDLHVTPAQSIFLDSLSATAAEVNYLVGVTSPIQPQLNGKQDALGYVPVNKAGDTMTGFLVLHADPSAAMHAVTKNYADNMIIDGGEF